MLPNSLFSSFIHSSTQHKAGLSKAGLLVQIHTIISRYFLSSVSTSNFHNAILKRFLLGSCCRNCLCFICKLFLAFCQILNSSNISLGCLWKRNRRRSRQGHWVRSCQAQRNWCKAQLGSPRHAWSIPP